MHAIVSNAIRIENPTPQCRARYVDMLTFQNPEYAKKERMGFWTGNTPRVLSLMISGASWIEIPFGMLSDIFNHADEFDRITNQTNPHEPFIDYKSQIRPYNYQEEAIQAALKKRNGVIVAPCGSGKTQIGIEIIARLGLRALWLTHTGDLLKQSMERAEAVLDIPKESYGTITDGKINIGQSITFATVQTMCKIDLDAVRNEWDVIVTDECFPGNTKIMTADGEKELQFLANGDIIASYNRNKKSIEYKPVTHVFKLKAHNVVSVKLSNGKEIFCTKNHPFFTKNGGWKNAEDLTGEDHVMQLLPSRNRRDEIVENSTLSKQAAGLGLLLKRMRLFRSKKQKSMDRYASKNCKREYEKAECKTSRYYSGKNENKQSNVRSSDKRKSFKTFKRDRTSSSYKMRKWNRADGTTTDTVDCVSRENKVYSLCRVSDPDKNEKRIRLSDLLQGRHRNCGQDDCDRSGRSFSSCVGAAGAGQEEGRFFEWVRVDSVTIQEQTSDGTFGGLCADGYVYNIEVADNNNYFAEGILVHNCHHVVGTPTKLQMFYKVISKLCARYKFGLTATPKRSDGLISCMYALLGQKLYEVSKTQVKANLCPVRVFIREVDYTPDFGTILAPDGTLQYTSLITDMTQNENRNRQIVSDIAANSGGGRRGLVLTDRVQHIGTLANALNALGLRCVTLHGSVKKAIRNSAIEDLKNGKIDLIVASFSLAREGLDIPNLDDVFFVTPQKNETVVVQSAGRVARKSTGKKWGNVYDYVDSFGMLRSWGVKRRGFYKKCEYSLVYTT